MHALASHVLLATCSALASPAAASGPGPAILFVDDSAPSGGDGTSWGNAFRYLQDALTAARVRQGVSEIRLAQGTYKPDQGDGIVPGDRNSAFDLVNSVALLGGYAGIGAPDPDARDFLQFATILSGDLAGNDGPEFANYDENTWRIVRATGLARATLVEGLTITASARNAAEPLLGGGILCSSGDLTVHHCRFVRNRSFAGGGIAVRIGRAEVRQCTFDGNYADTGGAGYVDSATPIGSILVEDCNFIGNRAFPGDGGALRIRGADPIRRSVFIDNHGNDAGAVHGAQLVEDCVFLANSADYGGAAFSSGTFLRCRFESNVAGSFGGAYAVLPSATQFQAAFVDCDFVRNRTSGLAGGAAYGGRAFVSCRFIGNQSGVGFSGLLAPGGAILIHGQGSAANVEACIFSANTAQGDGGAVNIANGCVAILCNCAMANNSAAGDGAAIRGAAAVQNSIFGPHAGTLVSGVTSVDYSCLPLAWPGMGNIVAADPGFVNPLGPDGVPGTEDDDLRLRADSPCIDAGNSNALPADAFDLDDDDNLTEPLPLDAFGNARMLETPATPNTGVPLPGGSAIVDMGAHEYRRRPDIWPSIGDGSVSINDLLEVINHWGPCAPPTPPDPDEPCTADIDGSGAVSISDLLEVILNWG